MTPVSGACVMGISICDQLYIRLLREDNMLYVLRMLVNEHVYLCLTFNAPF